ncbi:hypothetical protein JQX13_35395 [Archangium violaceum]|uniref:hypothetical protein n=1 Tax=Archangium violaceum TaxID=83451 RepID=UPI00193BDCCE|nr:hypothetical protein [Archangium violaceum]QRK05430.1 hypothetical protein JQX13_35395 [Archangium violaceum]
MATFPPTRAFVRPALLLSFFSLACNDPPPPTTPDPPQVSIQVLEPNTVGKSVKLSLSVSGCDQVQSLELLDNNVVVKRVTYGGNPTQVELGFNEIRFTRGISASLSLTARATCADGRTNVSQAQSATFFPVEEVVEPVDAKSQVVTDYFVVDGSGANAAFIGCGMQGNLPFLYRVKKSDPTHPEFFEMPIPCDATTTITDRIPAGTGWRWVWTRGMGAFAINTNFEKTALFEGLVDIVSVDPDGNAFISDGGSLRLTTPAGVTKWEARSFLHEGQLIGDPLLRSDKTTVVVPLLGTVETGTIHVKVGVLNYSDGELKEWYDIETIPIDQPPPVAFNPAGTVLYLATQGETAANVRACKIGTASQCKPGSETRLWITEDLPGYVTALVPYDNGSRLAALTTNRFWFLDVKDGSSTAGKLVNKDRQPLTPNGALVTRFAQPGAGAYSSTFYMFNSAAPTTSNPLPYPVELLATDAAEKGELYRYQVPGGSLYGALDDAGELWLRVGPRLVKPFAPAWYRERL